MEPSSKQQQRSSQKTKRRDRAARMLRQKQQLGRASSRGGGGGGGGVRGGEDLSENEGDESPLRREKRPPPPTRKKRNKEPVFQEDIIDGFAFLCFKTYEDLEKTVNKLSGKTTTVGETGSTEMGVAPPNETTPLIDDALPHLEKQKTTPNKTNKKANNANLHRVKKKNILNNKVGHGDISKEACLSSRSGDEIIARSGDPGLENDRQRQQNQQHQPPRTASRDQLSDASSHSLERGYMCDSESGNERGSEPECDLFSSKCDSNYIAKKNNPGHSNSCRSPPVLPPIHPVVVQNGAHHHPEPSTAAVAAVTASASPANTVSAMVVGSASPREPQIGSPAVLPIACPSPASPPVGVVPPSQPPFLQKGPSPATVPQASGGNNKEVESASGSKLMSNGYEAVSDTSPPPSPLAKLLSPSKFLHKRPAGPPVSSCRLEQGAAAVAVAPSNKPAAINVYDFVSDHSAPSSPDGVIFLPQLKSHHHHHTPHHAPLHHLHKGASSVQQPLPPSAPLANKSVALDKMNVSNGHGIVPAGMCPSSPMGTAPVLMQSSHKSALDMSMKSANGPPPAIKSACAPPVSSGEHRHHHQLSQQHHQHPTQQQPPPQQQQQQQQQMKQQQHHPSQHQLHHPPQQQQSSRPSSYSIPYSTSQPPVVRKISSSSPRMSPLPISMSLSSPVMQSSSSSSVVAPSLPSGAPSVIPPPPVNTRTFVTTTSTTLSASVSSSQTSSSLGSNIGPMGLRCSPVVTTSHPNTPTPVPPRDTHSSHSNSSLSSLSQLSSTPLCHKDGPSREGGSRSSHSNSGHHTPSASMGSSATAATSSTSAYTATSSLANLVFSKPHTWGSSSGPTHTTASSHASPLPSRSTPTPSSSLPLPPSLPPAHHTSPFGSHPGPPPPPLLPVAGHHGIFGPGSLTPTLPLDATTGPSPYRAETLFPQPNPDLLRRELDTRFLASQDHSIPIPPPPYMQTEVHQHGPLHQQPPFIGPPSLGAPLVTQPTPHLYEKYPKLDSTLYGRPSIGLSSYPPVSALFAPGGGASTPFVPPAHLTALQPKINSVPKTKSLKPGKWCAMHVRIAWEIYNHQQKQKRAEAHKAGMALAAAKPPADALHATNHLFSLPRQHDLSFSSSLLSAAASAHPRTPFETSSHHSTFLNPTPAHLGPFSRPGYPGFGGPGPGFSGLGPLGLPGSAVLGADLRSGCLTQDPWNQRTALSFAGNAPWGGLKEEAERDRIQHEQRKREEERKRAEQERREKEERERREHERREQERREMERREQERKEQERKERERKEQERREMERREMERREQERREQERQKERDRELRLHHQLQKNSAIVMNGEIRDHHLHPHLQHHAHLAREWERVRESREHPRSPVQPVLNPTKYETSLERQPPQQQPPPQQFYGNPRLDVKVKQERKDDEPPSIVRSHRTSNIPDDRTSSRKRPNSMEPEDLAHASRGVGPHGSLPPTLGLGPHGLVQSPAKDPLSHSQTSPLWGTLTPSPTVSSLSGATMDPYRTRDILQGRGPEPDRRFDPLVSVMSSQRDRCTSSELSRQLSNAIDLERQFLDREHAAAAAAHAAAAYDRVKLLPPPLRTNESPYMTPPTLPPVSASSFFSPPVSPYLNSLCQTAPGRSKVQGPPPSVINGLPPPLIPCTFPMQNPGFPTTNRTSSPMTHKLAQVPTTSVLNLHHDSYFPKDRREVNGHPADLESHLRL